MVEIEPALPTPNKNDPAASDALKNCRLSNKLRLETNDATGFLYQRCATGPVIISNIFLSSSLIALAEMEVGCFDSEDECGKIYGFKPSSLISIIAVVTGILSSFLLPFMGAIVDYTPNRHAMGVISSIILVTIQAIQIYTVQSTWFPMAILQAINGFMYQVVTLVAYGYLPEIALSIEEKRWHWYSSLYYIVLFGHQVIFLVIIAAIVLIWSTDSVLTAQISQAIDVIVTGAYFVVTFYYFTKKEAKAKLPEGSNLCGAGFTQVFRTAKGLYQHYPKTIGNFFLGCVFSEAAINSFSAVSVTYINEVLKFDTMKTTILFLIILLSTLPGSYFANWLSNKTSVMLSFKIQIVSFIIVNFAAFLILTDPSKTIEAYICGVFWGFHLGWYYPLEKLIYSVIIPEGQESELAGFFLYCTQILAFLPPLVFTIMNEAGVNLKWAGIHLNAYLFVGLVFFQIMLPWDECLEAAKVNEMRKSNELNEERKNDNA